MKIQNFSIDKMNNYEMWFMLDKIKQGPIQIIRRTPAGDEPVEGVSCFNMNNDHVIIGIDSFTRFPSRHNLVAISGDIEEIVNLQLFENIMNKYDVGIENIDKGYFVLTDSIVIENDKDWRCDNKYFGPLSYGATEGIEEEVAKSLNDLVSYDPILSVDGVAHLVYIHFKNDEEYRDYYANKAQLPNAGVTLSESLKLITEWATVADAPFNNQQGISQDAKQFLEKLNFDLSLVDYQSDMYVAEFLKGNVNARQRPADIKPLSSGIDLFIKYKMAYRCLSALISLYPDAWDLQEIIAVEKQIMDIQNIKFVSTHFKYETNNVFFDKQNIWDSINKDHHSIRFNIFYTIVENSDVLYETVKTTGTF